MSTPDAMSTPNTKIYPANCHCGNIKYSVKVSPPLEEGHEVVSCNCSICVRNGLLHVYIPKKDVMFEQSEERLKKYQYVSMKHSFCPNCGTSIMVEMADQNHEWADQVAMTVRPFKDIDIDVLKIKKADMKDKPPKYEV